MKKEFNVGDQIITNTRDGIYDFGRHPYTVIKKQITDSGAISYRIQIDGVPSRHLQDSVHEFELVKNKDEQFLDTL